MTLKVLTRKMQQLIVKAKPVSKVNSVTSLKGLQGLWAKQPRTKHDLQIVRQKLWS